MLNRALAFVLGTLRLVSLGAFTGYLVAGAALWLYQRHLVFEPTREMHAAPGDFSFPVLDTRIPVPTPAAQHCNCTAGGSAPRTPMRASCSISMATTAT